MNFWIWRHTWKENGSDEESIDLVNNAYENNYVCMQYEYGIQQQNIVTTSYNYIRNEMKEGDFIFLGGKDRVYAYSKICKPRKAATQPLYKLSDIPKGKKWIYNSKQKNINEVIRFEDAPVLYFDFSGKNKDWGQRIDVEDWSCFVKNGIYSKNIYTESSTHTPMRMISKEDGLRLIEELGGSVKMETEMDKLKLILGIKKNIILQGAPGTGKTYNTAALALNIIGEDITGLEHSEIMTKYNEYIKSGQIMFTTFHQSMDYEDFVEGLKPEIVQDSEGKQVGVNYIIKPGMFKNICTKAKQKEGVNIIECIDKYLHSVKGYENRKTIPTISNKSSLYVWWEEGNKTINTRSTLSTSEKDEQYSPAPLNIEKLKAQAIGEEVENNWRSSYAQAFINAVIKEYKVEDDKSDKPFVLIIDEINRGNVSKIFGELITLLEADKRTNGDHPITVTLPYSKDSFSVPSNLYIIGTMNTTDRSTGTLDYALRRRFAFVTLKSDRKAIENYYNDKPQAPKDKALNLFDEVYELLSIKEYKTDMNIEDLMVGHSYFMAKTEDDLRMKLDYEIKPLLLEYAKDGIISINEDKLVEIMNTWTI